MIKEPQWMQQRTNPYSMPAAETLTVYVMFIVVTQEH